MVNPVGTNGNTHGSFNNVGLEFDYHEIRLQNQDRIFKIFDYVIGYLSTTSNTPTILNNRAGSRTATLPTTTGTVPYYNLGSVENNFNYRYKENKEASIFANLTAHVTKSTELSAGIRRITFKENASLNVSSLSSPIYLPSATSCVGFNIAQSGLTTACVPAKKATIYVLSAKQKITNDILLYGTYGTSFRPGNAVIGAPNPIAPSTQLISFISPADETSKSYEIGLKSAWLNGDLTFNIAAYLQKFKNLTIRTGLLVPVGTSLLGTTGNVVTQSTDRLVAAVPAEIKGFEAELGFNPSDNFSFNTTLSYSDGKVKNGIIPCAGIIAVDDQVATCVTNTSTNAAPKWSGVIQSEYNRPLNDNMTGYVRGLFNWKGKSNGVDLNAYDNVKAYGITDVFLGLRDPEGSWDISAYARNIFDVERVINSGDTVATSLVREVSNSSRIEASGSTYIGITTTAPREFGLNFRVAFGSR